ncbi:MAG: tetratricopeptide repeat protein [Betaproteobacteria bacterium]|nr:tetratricopeptide repeat protein [Betaproteobacteria bacterium]
MGSLKFVAAGAVCIAAIVFSAAVRADEIQDISKLLKQGQHAQALDKVNAYLAAKPKDAQGRFLKGLILAEQNKSQDAIKVFTALSEDFPELPEPYNNLAVLYAGQGQYDKAKTALEMAIRTHPSYATAYENLGDIYAKMASQAYDKALQLDKGNAAAQTKLNLIKDLFSGSPRAARPSASGAIASVPAPAKPSAASPSAAASAGKPAEKAAEPAAIASAPAKPTASEAPAKPAEKPAEKTADPDRSGEVIRTVTEWAKAWSAKDADRYLSFYAKDFKTPVGESREAWEATRKERIAKPKNIQVAVLDPRVKFTDSDHAVVSFKQSYRSDTMKSSAAKTLNLARINGKWQIQQEQVGR